MIQKPNSFQIHHNDLKEFFIAAKISISNVNDIQLLSLSFIVQET